MYIGCVFYCWFECRLLPGGRAWCSMLERAFSVHTMFARPGLLHCTAADKPEQEPSLPCCVALLHFRLSTTSRLAVSSLHASPQPGRHRAGSLALCGFGVVDAAAAVCVCIITLHCISVCVGRAAASPVAAAAKSQTLASWGFLVPVA